MSPWVSQGSPWEPRKACPTSEATRLARRPLEGHPDPGDSRPEKMTAGQVPLSSLSPEVIFFQ
jgi:hypothetical protein